MSQPPQVCPSASWGWLQLISQDVHVDVIVLSLSLRTAELRFGLRLFGGGFIQVRYFLKPGPVCKGFWDVEAITLCSYWTEAEPEWRHDSRCCSSWHVTSWLRSWHVNEVMKLQFVFCVRARRSTSFHQEAIDDTLALPLAATTSQDFTFQWHHPASCAVIGSVKDRVLIPEFIFLIFFCGFYCSLLYLLRLHRALF